MNHTHHAEVYSQSADSEDYGPTSKTINLVPTWNAAVRIYVRLLMDPGVDIEAKQDAERELLRLADAVDAMNGEGEQA